jgi:hypothetical protein
MKETVESKCYSCLCANCDNELFCHWQGDYCEKFLAVQDALALIELDLITDKVIDFLFVEIENTFSLKYSDDDVVRYAEYLVAWFASHNEGEPIGFKNWYDKGDK